ncbi:PAS domain S-box protein [Paracidobacterium acidisoli]|uniref:histidine kinase n=1 Tax=Paracidobacterium acidisoli TaxID=2303751 RepID=A0A372IPX6_9BACT|nr:PAS domain S-box protein [Paracidobacterium acidisoli]MBT9331364.1 PAS domain S-box protein [Paracidobacterium acidisoli]
MNYLRNARLLTAVFAAALLLTAGGAWALAHFARSAERSTPWIFEVAVCWALAQILLILLCIVSFRTTRYQAQAERLLMPTAQLQRSILDSAGPMIIAADLYGRIVVFNPSAERMLHYRAEDVLGLLDPAQLFPPGEMNRVGEQLLTVPGRVKMPVPAADNTPAILRNYVQYVSGFPASRVRGFEMQFRRRDGSTFPAMVYLAAVRTPEGVVTGLVMIAIDISATRRAEHALRESEERYRDLFESSSEMIATLSPRGRYLYVNPAWQELFGMDASQFETLISFESAFPPEVQIEAAALFRRALYGARIERAPLRLQNADGGIVEVEASLSCRRTDDAPVSVRCTFRDVTAQNRRERRLAMQLEVSQVIGESTSTEEGLQRVLESLCCSLSFDFAAFWVVDEGQHVIRFHSSWAVPGRSSADFRRETEGAVFTRGQELPGSAWAQGKSRWVPDVREDLTFTRRRTARLNGFITGWAVPVRVGNRVTAIVEFFSRQREREDADTMATVETVCASIGQFMARSAQEALIRDLNSQKELILNSVADGIFSIGHDGRIDFVNPAASHMLEASTAELTGRLAHSVLHGVFGVESCGEQCQSRRALLQHESASGQDSYYRSDGKSFPVEFSLTPVRENEAVVGSVLSFRDISQRDALDRMKDEFISTVSHELRTPLTSIRGALGLLSSGMLGEVAPKAANLMRIAVSNSDRLVRLINDILDLERLQSGRAPLAFRQFALDEMAQQAIDAIQPMADTAQVKVELQAVPAPVEADPDRLLQVLTNLLSNAVKFSGAGSSVRVVVRTGNGGVTLGVIDEGRGIPADKLESIFDRFQQVDASDSRQKGGTGLGLAICRTIMEQHGGRIWAEQNPERGATFYVFLPERSRLDARPLPGDDAGSVTAADERAEMETAILLCEDDVEACAVLSASLQRHGYRVMEAEYGEPAAEMARESLPGAILIDPARAGARAWDTLRMLKSEEATAKIPVIVLSLLSREGAQNGTAEAAWVQKPADEERLLGELSRVLCCRDERARVLVVEDDPDLARVVIATFERDGILVDHAPTRRSAIELCERQRPDLILLDLALPDGDGFHVVDWLRQREEMRSLPLVVYSAREVSAQEQQQLRLGPTEFLTKARVQPQEVEALVLTMLRSRQNQKQMRDEVLPNS